MDTSVIIILVLLYLILSIITTVINEKIRHEKKKIHWSKVRYIQNLTATERELIFIRSNGRCQICGGRKKLCFYILIEDQSAWDLSKVEIRCSECKGYSLGFDYDRTIPEYTKNMVFERDRGRCINCGSTNNLTYDHIIPFKYGGASSDADNIQLLCSSCNSRKSTSFKY